MRLSAWTRKGERALDELFRALHATNSIDELSLALLQGASSPEPAAEQLQAHHTSAARALAAFEDLRSGLQPDPLVRGDTFRQAMVFSLRFLDAVSDRVQTGLEQSVALFESVEAGHVTDPTAVSEKVVANQIALLEAENSAIRMGNMLLDRDHPQLFLQNAVMSANSAVISSLRALKNLGTLGTDNGPGRTHVVFGHGQVARGRESIPAHFEEAALGPAGRSANAGPLLENLRANYEQSLATEEEILLSLDESIGAIDLEPLYALGSLMIRCYEMLEQRNRLAGEIAASQAR